MIRFREFSLLVRPSLGLLLEHPYVDSDLCSEIEIDRNFQIRCWINPIENRLQYFEYFELDANEDYIGLVTADDVHEECRILIFLEDKVIGSLMEGLKFTAFSNPVFDISLTIAHDSKLVRDQRVFAVASAIGISISHGNES